MDNFLSKEIDVASLMPPVVKDTLEFKEIARVENKSLNKVRLQVINLFNNRFVHSADENGIARWEKVLKLSRKRSDTLEERRQRVLAKINNKLPYTMRALRQLLNSIFGEKNYQIFYDSQEYILEVIIPINHSYYNDLDNTLEQMVPLNIYMVIAAGILREVIQINEGTYAWPFNKRATSRFKTASKPAVVANKILGVKNEIYAFNTKARVCGRFRAGGAL